MIDAANGRDIFVNNQSNLYVSDNENCRAMKWIQEGVVVAGG